MSQIKQTSPCRVRRSTTALQIRRSRWKCTGAGAPALLQQRLDGGVELRHRLFARELLAADHEGGRRIHGARHHAASTMLRRTGNLKAVQSLLGHASIHSSQRYAHVLTSELRAALEDETERRK